MSLPYKTDIRTVVGSAPTVAMKFEYINRGRAWILELKNKIALEEGDSGHIAVCQCEKMIGYLNGMFDMLFLANCSHF